MTFVYFVHVVTIILVRAGPGDINEFFRAQFYISFRRSLLEYLGQDFRSSINSTVGSSAINETTNDATSLSPLRIFLGLLDLIGAACSIWLANFADWLNLLCALTLWIPSCHFANRIHTTVQFPISVYIPFHVLKVYYIY